MAQRRRRQAPKPTKERKSWKIRYYTDVVDADGTRRRVRKTKSLGLVREITFRQAQKEAAKFLQPINDAEPHAGYASKTMNNLIQRWGTAVRPTLKRSTQDSYAWAFRRIQPAFGSAPVAAISRADVQEFLTAASVGLAPVSVRSLRVHLQGLLTVAVEWEWLSRNPAKGRFRLPAPDPIRPRHILTPEDCQRLVAVLPPPYDVAVVLACHSGLRSGELAALRWGDFDGRRIAVARAVYRGQLGTPKKRRSRRRVEIGSQAREALARWRSQTRFPADSSYIFAIRRDTPLDMHNVAKRHVKPAVERLGLPSVSWHSFRHTYTSWGRAAGVTPEGMRDQLGHASIATTLGIYSHLGNDGVADQIDAFVAANRNPSTGTPRASEGYVN